MNNSTNLAKKKKIKAEHGHLSTSQFRIQNNITDIMKVQ